MSVLIGHASIDENDRARGGAAGDQTGKEVRIQPWYPKPWTVVLRPDADIADKMARACEAGCANDAIGYDQNERNTLHTQAKRTGYDLSKITEKCETDCSEFMTVCAIAAGVKSLEHTGNAPTTHNMVSAFTKTGKFQVLKDARYTDKDTYLRRGDILLLPGSHTAMALSDGDGAIKEIAADVLADKYGKGEERKRKLEAEGHIYRQIQDEVTRQIRAAETPAEHVSQAGIDLIKKKESCRLTAYKLDGEKYYTIGWGHSGADVKAGQTMTQAEADATLRNDLVKYENYVKKYATDIVLTQPRLDALTSYTYNRGAGGMKELASKCSTVAEYAAGIVKYWGSNQRYKDALIARRKEEQALFLS